MHVQIYTDKGNMVVVFMECNGEMSFGKITTPTEEVREEA